MISLSTCTTVPSMWSQHIAVSFLRTYKGYHHAPCMFIINQHFLYSFFLILEFLLWTSCPWPNHCCLTQVTQGEQKQKTHPVQRPGFLDLNGPHQHLQLHWWHWHSYHPSFQSLAQHSLQWYQSVAENGWTKLFLARNISTKFRKGREIHEHNPIQFFYRCFLLTVKPKQSQSQSTHFPGIASCLSQQWKENNCVWNVSRAMECRPVLVSRFLYGER